jgi:predicted RNase H-like HicB family nuclease
MDLKERVMHYVGILDGGSDVWGVRVPDVEGCVGGGPTPEAAVSGAIEALRDLLVDYEAAGVGVRPPRTMAEISADPECGFDPKTESIVMIPAIREVGRIVKANISIDAGALAAIDEAARRRGMTRSAFLTAATLATIERDAV